MDPALHTDVSKRLLADYEFKPRGEWLREGRCPGCGKRELYTHAQSPWLVKCGRLNKCGWEGHVKELYPDLFESWSDRFQATPESPTAAADAYLVHARGFQIDRIKGWYTQESYFDRRADAATATVRFALPGGGYWERLIDKPARFGKKKAHFATGKRYKGQWWCPPALDLGVAGAGKLDELWLVEGIFDAISLWLHGVAAVAVMSSSNYPGEALAALKQAHGADCPTLVWALDGDHAGRAATRKHVRTATRDGFTCEAAQIPQPPKGKLDWNDLHQRHRLGDKHLPEYRYHGALLLAKSATDKALLVYQHEGWAEFPFDHGNRLYWFKLDLDRYNKAMDKLAEKDDGSTEVQRRAQALAEANAISEMANCLPRALYYQANAITDEAWYYFRVGFPHDGEPVKATFTSAQITAAAEFKKRIMHIAPGAQFKGSTKQLDRFLTRPLFNIKRVETVDFIGYAKAHEAYVFGDVAVSRGRLFDINSEDYFDIDKLAVKSLNKSVALTVNRDRTDYRTDWLALLWDCFGPKGIVALTFWFGSLFAEQIRAQYGSFPFLEVIGEAGAGKSTLLEFLWKLLGRYDYEGFDPSKSTLAARARIFAQVSNLPTVLIEGDRSDVDAVKVRQFDWDELKPMYNGRSVRARGMKTSGNETYEPPFRGAVVISQNAQVQASEAVLQRICHLHFDRANHSPENKRKAETLARTPMEQVSGFILAATVREQKVMDTIAERLPEYERILQGHVKVLRIAQNHALLLALMDALGHVLGLDEHQRVETGKLIREMAIERQRAISADHPIVAEFWDAFEYLNAGSDLLPVLDHSRNEDYIAINLVHFAEIANRHGVRVPTTMELKKHLPAGKSHKFVARKSVCSALFARDGKPRTVTCWVFAKPRG